MRKALVVGIDKYSTAPLTGCVNDARRIARLLQINWDGSPNFYCKKLVSSELRITRSLLKEKLEELFSQKADVALFFYAGHGIVNNLGGYLVTQDRKRYDEGVSMADVLTLANLSKIEEIFIILDCCYSGAFGTFPILRGGETILREGVSVLCASRSTQVAEEKDGSGVFTTLVCDALEGGAANLVGKVTIASIYDFVDQALVLQR